MRRVLACRLWQAGVDIKSLSSIKWSSAVEQMIQMDGKVTLGACSRQDNKVAFWRRLSSASGDAEETREITNPKVLELADRIVELNMLEVSDLTELLRKRLNVQTPSVPMGFAMPTSSPAAAVSAPGGASAAADSAPAEEKTDFNVKLTGFDAASKIKVIKEVRAITDLGLKEAKELVEKSPTVIKEGMSKEDAEELKAKLEAAGAQISLE